MISLDTNILVRLLTNDEPRQTRKARVALDQAVQDQHRIWVSLVVVCELVWILRRLYGYDKAQVIVAVTALLKFSGLELENPKAIKKALDQFAHSPADFSDILLGHLSMEQGAAHVLTFDKKAAKLATHKLLP
jgi:predicted nucleic-acid-binding protein